MSQLVGIGFNRTKKREIIELFEWDNIEIKELSALAGAGGRDTLEDKKYRHVDYHCEAIYALAIAPKANISGNPGCEWQLKYFGR